MSRFTLALLNPNTNADQTVAMADVARSVLPDDCDVVEVTAERGPRSIESDADAAVAAAETVDMVRCNPGASAYLIACFGDPGLDGARELTSAPVVGVGEAAFSAAAQVSRRFAVLTTLPRGIPKVQGMVDRAGMAGRCAAVVAIERTVEQQGAHDAATTQRMIAAGEDCIDRLEADAIVLACGGMADVARELSVALGVPVCEGVSLGALQAWSLWRCGLRTSKVGSYSPPEPIAYLGMEPLSEGAPQ